MLKKRIIPTLLLRDNRMVKGKNFNSYIDVGDPTSCIKIYNAQYADELIFIDINKDRFVSDELFKILKTASKNCFIPLTAGGGINSIKKISKLLLSGADKVILNSTNFENPKLIYLAAKKFGSQCIVVGVDIKKIEGQYFIFSDLGIKQERKKIKEYITECTENGAGEFFINSIDNDGLMEGYDINLINEISKHTSLPIIASGGAGNFNHVEILFKKTKSTGAACGSIFYFADNNPIRLSTYLTQNKIAQKKIK